jgi:8-oxo-dGTP diphosphatase
MSEAAPIVAAGAVVVRKGPEVLLVHRPKYDDWSFAKGKVDPGEHVTAAAVREVAEETGLDVRLGPPLPLQQYLVGNGALRTKVVHYWVARVAGDDDVSTYSPNAEIDAVIWVPLDKAPEMMTYERDHDILEAMTRVCKKSHPLVVLRHGKAESRKAWNGDDRERPLTDEGEIQSEQVVPVLAAYDVHRVISSSSRRCWTTVSPYADVADLDVEVTDDLSEEDASPKSVASLVRRILERSEPTVVCTHRPVLPHVYDALGLRDPELEAGEMLVVHHRHGRVVAVEHHRA